MIQLCSSVQKVQTVSQFLWRSSTISLFVCNARLCVNGALNGSPCFNFQNAVLNLTVERSQHIYPPPTPPQVRREGNVFSLSVHWGEVPQPLVPVSLPNLWSQILSQVRGQRYPLNPTRTAHATDRMRRGRYEVCPRTRGLSSSNFITRSKCVLVD